MVGDVSPAFLLIGRVIKASSNYDFTQKVVKSCQIHDFFYQNSSLERFYGKIGQKMDSVEFFKSRWKD